MPEEDARPVVTGPIIGPAAETAAELEPEAPAVPVFSPAKQEEPEIEQTTFVPPSAAPWRIAGEVLDTYIVCEDEDKNVWLIDKHAAHERVNFDRMKANQEPLMCQALLAPLVAEFAAEEYSALAANLELLREFGFECEEFGGGSLILRAIPADIDSGDAIPALEELADKLVTAHTVDPAAARDALLHTMACKAAIKGGWKSDLSELRVLVDKVQSGEVQFCPHGRPVKPSSRSTSSKKCSSARERRREKMKLVCVVGPTGCGKTWLGVELAKMLGGEVVSCDSMQIYRGMLIGTAAPTAEEMQGIPHHMVGVADPRENYSVARYADDAAKCVDDILSRGKQPVIVGGTGLYLNALLAGHGFAGGDKDGRYRAELESRWDKEGGEAMFVELRRIDPETAGNLHLNDKKRILRALEVYYETGKTMAQHNAETKLIPPRYDSVRIGLAYEDRDDMKRAIDLRVDKMVEAGLFDEVRALLDSGLPRDVTAMQAIGYKETLAYLDGEAAREEAIDEIKLRSRQYAKRQLTWLRRDPSIHWFYWKKTRILPDCLAFSTEILHTYGVS